LNHIARRADINLVGWLDRLQAATDNELGKQKSIVNWDPTTPAINISGAYNSNLANITVEQAVHGIRVGTGYTGKLSLYNLEAKLNRIGILVEATQSEMFAEDILVQNNSNPNGSAAGISCKAASVLTVVGNSIISDNVAMNLGAGLSLQSDCVMTMVAGTDSNVEHISRNSVSTFGGGVYVDSGAQFMGTGDVVEIDGISYGSNNTALQIVENETQLGPAGFGGGIYTQGTNTQVVLSDVNLSRNKALRGGAVYASVLAQVLITQSDRLCWSNTACNLIDSNESTQAGGALYLIGGVKAEIHNTRITKNRASRGLFALVIGQNAELRVFSSIVDSNGNNGQNGFTDATVLTVENQAVFTGGNLTVVDNLTTDKVFINDNAVLSLSGSYIYNPQGGAFLINQNQGVANLDCLFVDAINNLSAPDVTVMSALDYNNSFANPTVGEYRTKNTATGLDQCSDQGLALLDIDLNNTGYDDPNVTNVLGAYDAGAHENISSDVIFENGFEQSSASAFFE